MSSYLITPGGIRSGSWRKLDLIRSCFKEIYIDSKLNDIPCLDCIVSPKIHRLNNHKEKYLKTQTLPVLTQNNKSVDSDVEDEIFLSKSFKRNSRRRKTI